MFESLADRWREEAVFLRKIGGSGTEHLASVLTRAASELEAAIAAYLQEDLSLVEAARETGYSPDHIGRVLRRGQIENVGRPNAPRVRRGDLPFKSGVLRERLGAGETGPSREQIARSIIDSYKEAKDAA